MKRLYVLASITVILFAVMAYGVSASGAWFTDQVSIQGNSITTGNIDLVVSDLVSNTPVLEPGGDYSEIMRFCLKNGGTYNMKWRGMLDDVQAPDGMVEKILLRGEVIAQPSGKAAAKHDNGRIPWFTDQPAKKLMAANTHILFDETKTREPFKPNDRSCYSIQAKLSGDANNAFQQKTFSASLQLDATQWISTSNDWSQ